jgi:neutral ceramidase
VNRRKFFKTSALAGVTLSVHGVFDQPASAAPTSSSPKPENLTPQYFGQVDLAAESRLLKAGFAERDITPARGMQMDGNYLPDFVKGFHDKCKVRAAVFDDGTQRLALVGVDSIVMHRDVVEAARKTIEERCRIPGDAIMIGAAHDHSAGPVGMLQMKDFEHAPQFVQHLARDKSQFDDPGYVRWVLAQIVDAVCEADGGRAEAYCGAGIGTEDKVAFTRRFRMKNGLTYTHPGQGNPDIIESSGPIDPQVGVVGAWDKRGRFLGCIVNYTCHATTNPGSGSDASANWIYYMERVIRGAMGAEVPVVFLQGAAGNVTQVDNLSSYEYPKNTQWAEFVGGRVGAEAVKVLLTMVPGSLAPLSAQSVMLEIKRRVPSAEHVHEAHQILEQETDATGPASAADQTKRIFAKETVLLEFLVKQNPVVPVEIQTIQVGPVVFVSNPAELFCRAGLEIKAGSHFEQTAIVSYANGAVGYVPDAEALGPHGGGYETRLTSYTNLEISASAQIVKASIDLISRMQPGTLPVPQKAPPFRGESTDFGANLWSFGDVPAQLD